MVRDAGKRQILHDLNDVRESLGTRTERAPHPQIGQGLFEPIADVG